MILILAFVVFSMLSWCSGVGGTNLYPSCQGEEVSGSAGRGNEVTIYTVPRRMENLTLTCLAYEVTSLMGGMESGATDPCSVSHQTEYLYRFLIRAQRRDEITGKVFSVDFDVKDIAGGSLGNIAIRLPEEHVFSLVFVNQGLDSQCSLKIRAIMDYTEKTKMAVNSLLPVVISVEPRTVYIKQSSTTRFIFRYPSGTDAQRAQDDVMTLTTLDKECTADNLEGFVMRQPSSLPALDAFGDNSTLGARDYFFDIPETYRICYRRSSDTRSSELAVVRVFDGNPAYYEVVSGDDKEGRVFVGVPTTLKFHGYGLDTRSDGDRAKLVEESEDCATAAPAGGVPEATNLGPKDDFGPGTVYSLWTWTLRGSGVFKICYKRRSGVWTEVPSVTDVGPGVVTHDDIAPPANTTNIPHPKDPVTHKDCPMAPENTPQAPWVVYKSIKLTMNESKISGAFLKTLSQVFCIPRAALAATHVTHNQDGFQVMYISVLCEDLENSSYCDTMERQNYIVSLGKSIPKSLSELGITSVEGSTHMFAFGDDPVIVKREGGHVLATSIVCCTLLLVTCVAVYGVLKYREHREYFIQFGTDEEDVDDMYAAPGRARGAGRRPIENAVIEVED